MLKPILSLYFFSFIYNDSAEEVKLLIQKWKKISCCLTFLKLIDGFNKHKHLFFSTMAPVLSMSLLSARFVWEAHIYELITRQGPSATTAGGIA